MSVFEVSMCGKSHYQYVLTIVIKVLPHPSDCTVCSVAEVHHRYLICSDHDFVTTTSSALGHWPS